MPTGLALCTQDLLKRKKENFLRFHQLFPSLCLLAGPCLEELRATSGNETITKASKSRTLVAGGRASSLC